MAILTYQKRKQLELNEQNLGQTRMATIVEYSNNSARLSMQPDFVESTQWYKSIYPNNLVAGQKVLLRREFGTYIIVSPV